MKEFNKEELLIGILNELLDYVIDKEGKLTFTPETADAIIAACYLGKLDDDLAYKLYDISKDDQILPKAAKDIFLF